MVKETVEVEKEVVVTVEVPVADVLHLKCVCARLDDERVSRHHAEIVRWRRQQALRRTLERRPDLLAEASLDARERTLLDEIRRDGCRVLTRRTSLTPVRKLWIAWRTWLTA